MDAQRQAGGDGSPRERSRFIFTLRMTRSERERTRLAADRVGLSMNMHALEAVRAANNAALAAGQEASPVSTLLNSEEYEATREAARIRGVSLQRYLWAAVLSANRQTLRPSRQLVTPGGAAP